MTLLLPARFQAIALLSQILKHLFDDRCGEAVCSRIKMAIFGPRKSGLLTLFIFRQLYYSFRHFFIQPTIFMRFEAVVYTSEPPHTATYVPYTLSAF